MAVPASTVATAAVLGAVGALHVAWAAGSTFPLEDREAFSATFLGVDADSAAGSDRDYKAMVTRLKAAGADIPEIFLACGESDFILERSRDYHRFLEREGVAHRYEEGPGGHDWTFWDTYIKKVVDWLPLDEDARDGRHSGNVMASTPR